MLTMNTEEGFVITINRELGSGGRTMGGKVADHRKRQCTSESDVDDEFRTRKRVFQTKDIIIRHQIRHELIVYILP